ncbi:D-glycero-beta-D-manno-heptose-1,7-bisphosphate 7-phosphatase [Bacillus thuringiensis]|uniref:D,D-heptose 1,7-bisphosphate phosphatase n=1 Tax=Bacillus thuringiensis TaxID=1428 RepID=A0ABD6SAX1_BACTU|nr:HAD family hydrolase [Bacillus thuringiensis]PER45224.1 D-glycero-beta-D-manno-heptose-1,7-bisphosphate 7-phosphatase [Bacillus thuringiensis]PEU67295.1 D-glycero-beta-D-manno-heptose-1,7-bisphosphate 7-phosphatase [Bacillus thuringiensis]PFI05587.1 D-glycero-beta-D-manno-heptose-1,7-bisphosphate 7-phosphatase [Bacillus thuringiensis]PFW36254.1 D-glycero-beta-D-manno-heptose-1,7-bisphosphate 7-phosphatase [Bacillus thuringiensis]PGY81001.1 D-glycero-beta-D-manno-heptose-1,7-bisphosphate 7-p
MHQNPKKKAIFLDRDGVINQVLTDRVRFVNKPEDIYLLPGAADAIAIFNRKGYMVLVTTNQAGVGLGYMTHDELLEIHGHMQAKLINKNPDAHIHEFVACTHRPKDGCSCRKPEAGMLLQLARKYDIDLAGSYMIGDQETDICAGKKAGTKTIRIASTLEETQANFKFSSLINLAHENIF